MMARTVVWMMSTGAMFGCATTTPTGVQAPSVGGIPIGALAEPPPASESQIALGRLLFHDPRLSREQRIACSGCHKLSKFGVDGRPAGISSVGLGAAQGVSLIFNTQTHVAQVWDASAVNIDTQVIEKDLGEHLGRVPRYVDLFRHAFPQDQHPISLRNVAEAIEAFERGLVTNSRWDKFAAGDVGALTVQEKNGLRVFLQSGCVACHSGPQIGGTMYQRVGLAYPWPSRKEVEARADGTNSVVQQTIFRVPSLKNIAETAPYFHDGSTSDLHAAIRLMGHHQLGIELSNQDVNAIAAWMRTLTGDVDPEYIAVPDLP